MEARMTTKETESEDDQSIRCGIGKYRPRWLQVFNNPYVLCVFLSIYSFMQGMILEGVHNMNTVSYERRFGLSSKQVGLMAAASDVSSAVAGVVIGLLASNRNKAKWITFGALATTVGLMLMSLPHFTTGLYVARLDDDRLCSKGGATRCDQNASGLQNYLYLIMFGYFVTGVSGAIALTVAMTYIHDSFPAKSATLYTGTDKVSWLLPIKLGNGVGFAAGGQTIDLYVDFEEVSPDKKLTPDDPRWVGAWWLCFVVGAAIFFAFAAIFFLYGEELPSARELRRHQGNEDRQDATFKPEQEEVKVITKTRVAIKQGVATLTRVVKRSTVMCLCFGYACTQFLIQGISLFITKIIQNQFGKTGSFAALLSGVCLTPGAFVGIFLGGLLTKKWKLDVVGCLRLVAVLKLLAVPTFLIFLLHCEQAKLVGWNRPYFNSSLELGDPAFEAPYNHGCGCRLDLFEPVCDTSGSLYFSPCFAGCHTSVANQGESYGNCTCLDGDDTVSSGFCDQGCDLVSGFLAALFVTVILVSTLFIPMQTAIVRNEKDMIDLISGDDQTVALGLLWFIVRLTGCIPGPIINGAVIDVTCVVWGETCWIRESCWIYDNALLARNLCLLGAAVCGAGFLLFALGYKLFTPTPIKRPASDAISLGTDTAATGDAGTYEMTSHTLSDVSVRFNPVNGMEGRANGGDETVTHM